MRRPEPRGLIFDCDGTLALTADLHFNAFNAALARQGAGMDRAWYEARKGLDRTDLIAAFTATHPVPLAADRLVADSLALTIEKAETTAVENPPVAAFARRMHGRMPIAVASNAETPIVRAILKGAGLDALFDIVITVVEAKRPKPDPAVFLMTAQAMGLAPADCLVLEDSAQGLAAARAAGMAVLDVRQARDLARLARFAPDPA
jgi:HAD superfamily hydrolase (TIGR01493 family)